MPRVTQLDPSFCSEGFGNYEAIINAPNPTFWNLVEIRKMEQWCYFWTLNENQQPNVRAVDYGVWSEEIITVLNSYSHRFAICSGNSVLICKRIWIMMVIECLLCIKLSWVVLLLLSLFKKWEYWGLSNLPKITNR